MATEKQSNAFPQSLVGKNYGDMDDQAKALYGAYFDQQWPLFTTRNLLAAAGVGAGARGLYHLIRHFTAEKAPTSHQSFYAGPKMFASPKKKQPAEKTAENPPAAASPSAPAAVQPPVWQDQRPGISGTWLGLGNIAGGALATVGGAYLMDKLVNMNKHKKYEEEVEAARRQYEAALGEKIGMLHEIYDIHQEKISNVVGNVANAIVDGAGAAGKFLTNKLPYYDGVNHLLQGYNTYATGAAGLSAALAGKIVYDLTRQRSQAEVLRRAQDARARMSALPPLWVTPDDVVSAKEEPVETEAPRRKAASV